LYGLRKGGLIGVRGPFGSAWPVEQAQGSDIVFVAGGIGLAPLRPAIYQTLRERHKYGKVVLLYGARNPAEMLYNRALERWRGRFDMDVFVTVDRADRDWFGNVGVVTRLIDRAAFDPAAAVAMICGPEIMMRFAVMGLRERGVPEADIHVSMERNMKCAIGFCGHCQFGPAFICREGPVFPFDRIKLWFDTREI
jgi:NAD(P)H-flavin reductase